MAVYFGRWVTTLVGGEFKSARENAEKFLRAAKTSGRAPDIASAARMAGLACLHQGHFRQARVYLEEALGLYDSEWDDDAKSGHGTDSGIMATIYLAIVSWLCGDFERGRELFAGAKALTVKSSHVPTRVNAHTYAGMFETLRGDADAVLRESQSIIEIAEPNRLAFYVTIGANDRAWARARLGDLDAGMAELRQGLAKLGGQGVRLAAPLVHGRLAELEAEGHEELAALARIDEALALAQQTDEHWTDSLLHRIRGDILLKAHLDDPAPAEEAYLAAIAVAGEQGARSFGLQAALKLAKLYQSTARPVEAHDILAGALEGFEPTPEMSEIAEGQALLAVIADTDEWKSAAASRLRRLKLQTSCGKAMAWSNGFAAEETKAVLAQTERLAALSDNVAERMKAHHARWMALFVGGEFESAHEATEVFLREAKLAGEAPAVASAGGALGLTCLFRGRFAEAREHCREALRVYSPGWEASVRRPYGTDTGISAKAYLAMVPSDVRHSGDYRRSDHPSRRVAIRIAVPNLVRNLPKSREVDKTWAKSAPKCPRRPKIDESSDATVKGDSHQHA